MMSLGVPRCTPVITRDQLHQTNSHPKYLVMPGSLVECVKEDDLRIKIIDLGEGTLWVSRSCCRVLRSRSLFQCRSAPKLAHSVTSSGAGGDLQPTLDAPQD